MSKKYPKIIRYRGAKYVLAKETSWEDIQNEFGLVEKYLHLHVKKLIESEDADRALHFAQSAQEVLSYMIELLEEKVRE